MPSHSDRGNKEEARSWNLVVSGVMSGVPVSGNVHLQVFTTLRQCDRLAKKRKSSFAAAAAEVKAEQPEAKVPAAAMTREQVFINTI